MVLLTTFTDEMEAQLLCSRLKEAGIDYKLESEKGENVRVQVFEDDLEEAQEIMHSRADDDDDYFEGLDEDVELDSFADEDL